MAPLPTGTYCKIPKDYQGNVVRGARNYPCADVPGKRAATPKECRSNAPYVPLGTNPWYGDPNQILTCPAPAARCDQPVKPGYVVPAPTINNGMNPLPADQLPGTPPPVSDPLTAPGQGSISCSGQQPNPCIYTPASGPAAIYSPSSGEVVGPDGVNYTVTFKQTRRRRMEGDAGTSQLNPTGQETDAPEDPVATVVAEQDEDTEPEAPADDIAEGVVDGRRQERLGRGWFVGICAVLVLLAAGVGVGGYLALRSHDQSEAIARDDALAIARAKECVAATQAPDAAAMTASQSKIIECSTGDFAVQANLFAGMLVDAYQAASVNVQVSDLRAAVRTAQSRRLGRRAGGGSRQGDQLAGRRSGAGLPAAGEHGPADGTYKVAKLDQVTS